MHAAAHARRRRVQCSKPKGNVLVAGWLPADIPQGDDGMTRATLTMVILTMGG